MILGLIVLLKVSTPWWYDIFRWQGTDLIQSIAARSIGPARTVAIVEIDDLSLERLGPWPWRRDTVARLVRAVADSGARGLVISILTPQADARAPWRLSEENPDLSEMTRFELASAPDPDILLADAIKLVPTALATSVSDRPGATSTSIALLGSLPDLRAEFGGVVSAYDPLSKAAYADGALNLIPEPDQIVRRMSTMFFVRDTIHPSLATAALLTAGRKVFIESTESGVKHVRVGLERYATDAHGRIWPIFATVRNAPVISAANLLAEGASDTLEGRIVVLGLSAAGLSETWRLPDRRLVNGVRLHAGAIESLETGRLWRRGPLSDVIELLTIVVFGLGVTVLWWRGRSRVALATTVGVALGWALSCFILLSTTRFLLDPMLPALAVLMVGGAGAIARLSRQEEDRRKLILALQERTADAEAASTARSRFLAGMSHDLRTPLNTILGFASIIRDELHGRIAEGRYRDYARDIHISGEHLLTLVRRILMAAEAESGSGKFSVEIVRLSEIIDTAMMMVRVDADKRGVNIEGDTWRIDDIVEGDRTSMLEIVVNLLSNAVRHSPEDGVVQVRLSDEGDTVSLTVVDKGPGMSPEMIRAIGRYFLRKSGDRAPDDGLGLGLYLVKMLCERQGGVLEIKNRPGGGLSARVTLPREAPDGGKGDAVI